MQLTTPTLKQMLKAFHGTLNEFVPHTYGNCKGLSYLMAQAFVGANSMLAPFAVIECTFSCKKIFAPLIPGGFLEM